MRVIIDTNVLISALISPSSPPYQVVQRGLASMFDLMVSEETLNERIEKCQTKRSLKPRISPSMLENLVEALRITTVLPALNPPIEQYTLDVDDDQLIAHAIADHADVLVSGDRHLLNERDRVAFQILTPAEFVAFLTADEP